MNHGSPLSRCIADVSESEVFDDQDDWWLGMYDDFSMDRYVWLDGTIFTYTNFQFEQPNDVNQRCVKMKANSYEWYDIDCSEQLYYICKKPTGI